MFPRKLFFNDSSTPSNLPDPRFPQFRLDDFGYGKEFVRVMALVKGDPCHRIKEFLVSSHMKLATHKEYYEGINTDIVGSDVQEVNIYLHAKKHGLTTPEEFALSLTQHFLDTYPIVSESHVLVEELPWDRLGGNHNHAFSLHSTVKRSCDVIRKRSDPQPLVMSGLEGLRIMKTARSPFVGYIKAGLHTEGDNPDRVLCGELKVKWQYSSLKNVDFSTSWHQVRDLLLTAFAGDPEAGVVTTSVQQISYEASKLILTEIPQISSASTWLSNMKYFDFDFSRFPEVPSKEKNLFIYHTTDTPYGVGYGKVDRLDLEKNNKSKI